MYGRNRREIERDSSSPLRCVFVVQPDLLIAVVTPLDPYTFFFFELMILVFLFILPHIFFKSFIFLIISAI